MYPRLAVLALLSATNALAPPNVHHVPDFESARRELASSSSLVNAIVVEKSAAAVPAEAWDSVDLPVELELSLPDPTGDAAGTRARLRAALSSSVRGLAADHERALSACVAELSAEFARCCGGAGAAARGGGAVRAKLNVVANDARDAQRCPKYHTDGVPMRLIATLAGRGTQVIPDAAVDREAVSGVGTTLRDPGATPYDARAGDAVLLVGAKSARGARHAAVHRSPPPPAARVGRRVVLVLDEAEEHEEQGEPQTAQQKFAAQIMRMIVK